MKTPITQVYKYMLENAKFYAVTTKQQGYNNVLFINYACCSGYSRLIYLTNINAVEVFIITASIKNTDILQVQEQDGFIYF